MVGAPREQPPGGLVAQAASVESVPDLGRLLRELRRREARRRDGSELTYRDLAAKTGWSHGIIGAYFAGRTLPPTDRFDALIRILGAAPAEQGPLASARDRVEEGRRAEERGRSDERGEAKEQHRAEEQRRSAVSMRVPLPAAQELPPDVAGFTGRTSHLAELDRLLATGDETSAVVISAVSGTAGVGKTALAVRWAHRVAGRFPDGQLYVDLRGYDAGRPLAPEAVLAGFLRSLGVPGAEVPADLAERTARYRTLLAGRRTLVVLDNAYSAEQVRPLLPGTRSCAVLVTSRDDLAGLVARDGARRIELDVLSTPEAVDLLRALIGDRVAAEPAVAAVLADRCARLPLALRVAAELAATRPDATLADLADDLRDEQRRLQLLDAGGDPRAAVRAVFSWSCRHLPEPTSRAFDLLGLHVGREIDSDAAAALVDCSRDEARRLVAELSRAHLIQVVRHGRYGMHDLLRAYAAERAGENRADQIPAALTRLFDHYVQSAAAAVATVYPHEQDSPPSAPMDDPDTALAWLDEERSNLVAVSAYAAERGWPTHSIDLSRTLWRYLDDHAHYQDALAIHGNALRAADEDEQARAGVLTNLSVVHWRLGRTLDALDDLRQALAGYQQVDDRAGQARAMANLGVVHTRLGHYAEAGEQHERALAFYREIGDRRREGWQLINLGLLHERQGRYAEAADHQQRGAALFREIGDRRLEGESLVNLGAVTERMGRYTDALGHLDQALAISREIGNRRLEAEALTTLGSVYRRLWRYPEALDHLDLALSTTREIGDRGLEAETLNTLGETLCATRRPEPARVRHQAALILAEEIGNRQEQARALDGLAGALHAAGSSARAREHWRAALAIYTELDVPEAAQVRERLAGSSSD